MKNVKKKGKYMDNKLMSADEAVAGVEDNNGWWIPWNWIP